MKQKLIKPALVVLLLLGGIAGMGQANTHPLQLTADSLATGNYKDVFKSFMQLAVDHFTSNNKEIRFSSNPFAIMARMDTSLLVDTNYIKYTHLRNLNFSFSGKLDSAYHFNGFSSGITYALINQRDETVSRGFLALAARADDEFTRLNLSLDRYFSVLVIHEPAKARKLMVQKDSLLNGQITFNKMDPELQTLIKDSAAQLNAKHFLQLLKNDPKLNYRAVSLQTYDSLRALFRKRWLWTVGVSDTTYKDHLLFSNVVLSTELLKGISDPNHVVDVELDVKGAYHFTDDTLKAGRDLQRRVLNVEPGLNIVFNTRKSHFSWAEFKLSGEYNHIFKGAYTSEKTDSLTINGTLRIRITGDIWVPLEIKYDPRSGNVFGFLNVRLNFKGLGASSKKS